jgi:hypothetical protein
VTKILTRLKISEVSAVDRAAGENCKILLRKRDQDVVAKAVAALETSVASIINCDDDAEIKSKALAESFCQFEEYMQKNVVGGKALSHRSHFEKIFGVGKAGVTKAHEHRGPRELAASLVHHLHEALDRRRERQGFHKSKEEPMQDTILSIMKSTGIAPACAAIVKNGATSLSQDELVAAVSKVAHERWPELTEAQAFSKIYSDSGEEGRVLRQAIDVAKAWPSPMSLTPTVVGGADALLEVSDDAPSAYEKLLEMAERQRRAGETASRAFERVYLDPANRHLAEAERAQNRPRPTTNYPHPR